MSLDVNWDLIRQDVDPALNRAPDFYYAREGAIRVDDESAMAHANAFQMNTLQMLAAKAETRRNQRNYTQQQTFDEIANYLRTQYLANPVRDERGQVIGFDNLHLISEAKRKELIKNPFHSAYRYFVMRPNPLAQFDDQYGLKTYRDRDNNLHRTTLSQNFLGEGHEYRTYTYVGSESLINPDDLALIDNIWKAIATGDVPLNAQDGIDTADKAKELFAVALADLCRAHNRDVYRMVEKQDPRDRSRKVMEQEFYDDEAHDKNSCNSGVKQRIVQIAALVFDTAPENRELNAAIIQARFRGEMIAEKPAGNSIFNTIERMTLAELKAAKAGLDNKFIFIDDLTVEQEAALKKLEWWKTADIQAFIEGAKTFYGAARFRNRFRGDDRPRRANMQRYDNFGMMIIDIAKNALFDNMQPISDKLDARIRELTRLEEQRLEQERQAQAVRQAQERARQVEAERLAQARARAAVSKAKPAPKVKPTASKTNPPKTLPVKAAPKPPFLPAFNLHLNSNSAVAIEPGVAIEQRVAVLFRSRVGADFLAYVSIFPQAAQVLNQYSAALIGKLDNALQANPRLLDRITDFNEAELQRFLLETAFKQKEVILSSEHGELFKALVMSNRDAQTNFEALTYKQARLLDAKLSEAFVNNYMSWRPADQARFFVSFKTKYEQKDQQHNQPRQLK